MARRTRATGRSAQTPTNPGTGYRCAPRMPRPSESAERPGYTDSVPARTWTLSRMKPERIRAGMHRRKHTSEIAGGEEPRVALLEERVDHLNGQVAELAERLDFAERLLAQKRERTLRAGE